MSTARANFGAVQNRLEHRLNNLATYQENLTASESRIRDVDMAAEMTKFTKLNILQQAGTSMLAQANQAPAGRPVAAALVTSHAGRFASGRRAQGSAAPVADDSSSRRHGVASERPCSRQQGVSRSWAFASRTTSRRSTRIASCPPRRCAASKSMEKLSSGYRINRAADDAAGLAISEKMRGQIGGLAQAQRNAQDGISLVQTAEGALAEVHSMLQRVRDLKVQFDNGTLSTDDKDAIAAEVFQIAAEVKNIADRRRSSTARPCSASTGFTFQVGANDGETVTTTAADFAGGLDRRRPAASSPASRPPRRRRRR